MQPTPIPKHTFNMNPAQLRTDYPPEIDGNRLNLNLEIAELLCLSLLGSSIEQQLHGRAFLITFDPNDIQNHITSLKMTKLFDAVDVNAEQTLGSLWEKSRKFLNNQLERDDPDTLESETIYQRIAIGKMWSQLTAIFEEYISTNNAAAPNTINSLLQIEALFKRKPFYTIFTNRQAQLLLKCAKDAEALILNILQNLPL